MALSLNAMEKLLRKAGAQRVAEDAKEALAQLLEQKALGIGRQATVLAGHAGRRTVTAKDITLGGSHV